MAPIVLVNALTTWGDVEWCNALSLVCKDGVQPLAVVLHLVDGAGAARAMLDAACALRSTELADQQLSQLLQTSLNFLTRLAQTVGFNNRDIVYAICFLPILAMNRSLG